MLGLDQVLVLFFAAAGAEPKLTCAALEVGICGEHGGGPSSIEWCHLIGNNYVSCSPFRVPVARLAAAQSAIKHAPKK